MNQKKHRATPSLIFTSLLPSSSGRELLALGYLLALVPRRVRHQPVNNLQFHHRKSHRQDELVTIKLGLALGLVDGEGQDFVEEKGRALDNDRLLIFDVQLDVLELGVRQPDLYKYRIAVIRRSIAV